MAYTFIDLNHIFIYKALPEHMKERVIKLPEHIEQILLTPTDFSKVDDTLKKERIRTIHLQDFPERHLTQNSFLDTFTALVHQHGHQTLYFYKQQLNLNRSKDLKSAVKVLCGINAKDFIAQYTLKMVKDLQRRTDLNQREIGDFLQFSSRHSILQFLKRYDNKRM